MLGADRGDRAGGGRRRARAGWGGAWLTCLVVGGPLACAAPPGPPDEPARPQDQLEYLLELVGDYGARYGDSLPGGGTDDEEQEEERPPPDPEPDWGPEIPPPPIEEEEEDEDEPVVEVPPPVLEPEEPLELGLAPGECGALTETDWARDGHIDSRFLEVVDDQGRLVRTQQDLDGDAQWDILVYRTWDGDRLLEETTQRADGSVFWVWTWEYDDRGRVVGQWRFDGSLGVYAEVWTWEYEGDAATAITEVRYLDRNLDGQIDQLVRTERSDEDRVTMTVLDDGADGVPEWVQTEVRSVDGLEVVTTFEPITLDDSPWRTRQTFDEHGNPTRFELDELWDGVVDYVEAVANTYVQDRLVLSEVDQDDDGSVDRTLSLSWGAGETPLAQTSTTAAGGVRSWLYDLLGRTIWYSEDGDSDGNFELLEQTTWGAPELPLFRATHSDPDDDGAVDLEWTDYLDGATGERVELHHHPSHPEWDWTIGTWSTSVCADG